MPRLTKQEQADQLAGELDGRKCPNCNNSPVIGHPRDGCVLQALIELIHDRGNLTETEVIELHADCDADRMWNDLGLVIDKIENGAYWTKASK